jgi:hypothetical protein
MEALNKDVTSPDGSHAVHIEFEGEIRFGPTYFSISVDGRSLRPRIFGNAILWSPDSRFVALQEWMTTDYNLGPKTKLVVIDVIRGSEADIVLVDGGFVEATSIASGIVMSKGTYWGTGQVLIFRHELPDEGDWRTAHSRPSQ